jgi:excinuclease ABC subunit B
MSDAMNNALKETGRRREIQEKYNIDNNITPKTIIKEIRERISNKVEDIKETNNMSKQDKQKYLNALEQEMREAAKNLDFERAMELRDIIFEMSVD